MEKYSSVSSIIERMKKQMLVDRNLKKRVGRVADGASKGQERLDLTGTNGYSKMCSFNLGKASPMGRGRAFECEITVSPGVEQKLFRKHNIEIWEIEEAIYDDPHGFSIAYGNCYFVYGRTFSGRYLLVLVRILSSEETHELGFQPGTNVLKIITARDMNTKQRKTYNNRRGIKR